MKTIKNYINNSNNDYIRPVNIEYANNKKDYDINNLKVIGITGSTGKSTTAFIIHKYLQSIGKKTVLYSSIMVDNPASLIPNNVGYEVACKDQSSFLSILNEAEQYGAEYLVLEVNESTIEKGFIIDFPFTVRVLTNLIPVHNLDRYTIEDYINIKKSFFDIDDGSTSVLGFQYYEKELLDELIRLNRNKKTIICTNKTIKDKYNLDSVDVLLSECKNSINGLELKIETCNKDLFIKTNISMFHNAMNILTCIAVIKELGLFNDKSFSNLLSNFSVPGRSEVIKASGQYIIIDSHMIRVLENLKEYKKNGEINKIIIVFGSIGSGFRSWDNRFKTSDYIEKHHKAKKYAVEFACKYVDEIYFTESDSAKENPLDICIELESYKNKDIPSKIIVSRYEAIKDAIIKSNTGDAIFISGRGNRSIMCVSSTKVKHIKDVDIVFDIIKELGWTIDEK